VVDLANLLVTSKGTKATTSSPRCSGCCRDQLYAEALQFQSARWTPGRLEAATPAMSAYRQAMKSHATYAHAGRLSFQESLLKSIDMIGGVSLPRNHTMLGPSALSPIMSAFSASMEPTRAS
jgi:hypothetical protein